MTPASKILIALVFMVPLFLLNVFWGAYVSSTLWDWFLGPLGVATITYWHAVGIGTALAAFLGQRGLPTNDDDHSDEQFFMGLFRAFFYAIFIPALCLVFGWIAHINMVMT